MQNANELRNALENFTGTENWTRHWLQKNMLSTDGVMFFAEHAANGAFWFLDIVATELFKLQREQPFMLIKLVSENSVGTIIAEDGNDLEIYRRVIEFTDCPEGEWKFYLTDNVLLLPSEY